MTVIANIGEDPEGTEKTRAHAMFFIRVAMVEVIPIVLIFFGFLKLHTLQTGENLLIPAVGSLLAFACGCVLVVSKKKEWEANLSLSEKAKSQIPMFAKIVISMMTIFPLIHVLTCILPS